MIDGRLVAIQRRDQFADHGVMLAQWPKDLVATLNGQSYAFRNFCDIELSQFGSLKNAPLLEHLLTIVIAGQHRHRVREISKLSTRIPPGDSSLCPVSGSDLLALEINSTQPGWIGQDIAERIVILHQRSIDFSQLVKALPHHGVVADGVDPPTRCASVARCPCSIKNLRCITEIASIIVGEARVIDVTWIPD